METFVIVYFFDGSTKFDYKDFPSWKDAQEFSRSEENRINSSGGDVSVSFNEKG